MKMQRQGFGVLQVTTPCDNPLQVTTPCLPRGGRLGRVAQRGHVEF